MFARSAVSGSGNVLINTKDRKMKKEAIDLMKQLEKSSNYNHADNQLDCYDCGARTSEWGMLWGQPYCGACVNEIHMEQVLEREYERSNA